MNPSNASILLTFDIEDWFQVENLRQACPISSWDSYELRVERSTHRLLDLLDQARGQIKDRGQRSEVRGQRNSQPNNALNSQPDNPSNPSNPAKDRGQRSEVRGQLNPSNSQPNNALNSQPDNPSNPREPLRATFFVLGWIAERLPHLVREIHSRGHEVASHGYGHKLCTESSAAELRADLLSSRKLLEDITGERIYGYRAPNFSVSDDILKLIEESGYLYDSSYNSFAANPRYGKVSLNGGPRHGIAYKISDSFYEIPISNLRLSGYRVIELLRSTQVPNNPSNPSNTEERVQGADPNAYRREARPNNPSNPSNPSNTEERVQGADPNAYRVILPWGGGGYFRLIPTSIFNRGVASILKRDGAYVLYLHPWEVDPDQPRVENLPLTYKFRHYVNLSKTEDKLKRLIEEFGSSDFLSCSSYLGLTNAPSEQPIISHRGAEYAEEFLHDAYNENRKL
jgi:hypothetical protein